VCAVVGVEALVGALFVGGLHAAAALAKHVPVWRRSHHEIKARQAVFVQIETVGSGPSGGVGEGAGVGLHDGGILALVQTGQARAGHLGVLGADFHPDAAATLLQTRDQRRAAATERVEHPRVGFGEEAQELGDELLGVAGGVKLGGAIAVVAPRIAYEPGLGGLDPLATGQIVESVAGVNRVGRGLFRGGASRCVNGGSAGGRWLCLRLQWATLLLHVMQGCDVGRRRHSSSVGYSSSSSSGSS